MPTCRSGAAGDSSVCAVAPRTDVYVPRVPIRTGGQAVGSGTDCSHRKCDYGVRSASAPRAIGFGKLQIELQRLSTHLIREHGNCEGSLLAGGRRYRTRVGGRLNRSARDASRGSCAMDHDGSTNDGILTRQLDDTICWKPHNLPLCGVPGDATVRS